MSNSKHLIIDCLQYSKPERARFEEWRAGNVGCVHVTVAIWESARDTLTLIGEWNTLARENADLIALARTGADVAEITSSGRTAVILGFQDTSPFEDDIELVGIFYQLGVRVAQLTYNLQNRIGSGCWEEDHLGVSSYFGKNVILEMNRVGMLVDVSHCNHQTSMDAAEISERPIAITHGNPSDFVGADIELNRRNKNADLIKLVVERGGVIGLSMYPKIMRDGSNCTLDTFLDMMLWTIDLVGVEGVGFGTDFYTGWPESVIKWWRAGRWARESPIPIKGFSPWPEWFSSPEQFPSILDAMAKKGLAEDEIALIAGGNWLRLFNQSFEPEAS